MSYLGKRKFELQPILEKKASLNLEIVELQQKREQEEIAFNEYQKRVESIRSEIIELEDVFVAAKNEIVQFEKECSTIIQMGIGVVKDTEQIVEQLLAHANLIHKRIEEQKLELQKIQKQKQDAHDEITREWGKLSDFKDDLDIYKKRLEKEIKEANLDTKIIIHELL